MERVLTVDTLHEVVRSRLEAVRESLGTHVSAEAERLPMAGADYAELWHVLGEQFHGGKSLRPSLTIAAYAGLGGDEPDAVVPVAAAMEMLHTAMLVHDDILDHDEVRRGRPNVAGSRRAALASSALSPAQVDNHVLSAALLGGDLAIASSYDLISTAPLPAHHRLACLDLLTRAIRTTIAGELLDSYGDLTEPADADALVVAELKTATYTFVVPLLAGAQLAGADPTMIGHLERIGTALGVSFQLVDDDLGVFGDPEVTGKSNLSDLRSGKRTELMRLAFHRATEEQREELRAALGRDDLCEEDAARVREILVDSGARGQALGIARRQARLARRLAFERIPAPLSGYLLELIDMLEDRVS
ncbi:polyprenyl synthetase family protein [Demequina sp. NBRC 110054]|uniref:polyprenyl synthetase family protein n=1 Tax=Demequina sp. NBRC 110054 TaxID=1570343 RepID=UPI000A02498A|nr:polyprenyl synthetase family protein [Demequina sp. NBRC 110054]